MRTLYRPVGEKEMMLIIESEYKEFPPRLDWQPIFYPVLNEEYATEIAQKWNTKDEFGNYLGFVTKFEVSEAILSNYKIENVGGKNHNELWIPSEDLNKLNNNIIGEIEVVKVFIGENYKQSNYTQIDYLINNLLKNE